MAMTRKQPLWRCPKCGQTFVTRNLWHSCVRLTVDEFFGARRQQKRLYAAFLRFVRRFGPVTVNVTKSGISFQGRVRFAGVARVTRQGIVCGFWLKRRIDSPRLAHVELIPPRNYVYQFLLTDPAQLDEEVATWIREAYEVGRQEGERTGSARQQR